MDNTMNSLKQYYPKVIFLFHSISHAILIALLCLFVAFGLLFTIYFGDLLLNSTLEKNRSPLFGAYVIATQSMDPTIKTKDAIIIKRIDHDEYNVGDIITFASVDYNNKPLTVTHRIVQKRIIGEENSNYVTKGDNNLVEDPLLVNTSSIYGKVMFRIPNVGYIGEFFSRPSNYFICLLIPAFLFIFYEVTRIFYILNQKKVY